MTQATQFSPLLYIDSRVVDLSALNAASQSPEEQIEAFKQDALARADHLPLHQQSMYRSQVHSLVCDLRSQLLAFSALIQEAQAIRIEMGAIIARHNGSLQDLYARSAQYNTDKGRVEEQNRSIARQLQATNVSLTHFAPKRERSTRENLSKSLATMDMQEHLLDLNITANIVRATGELVVETAKTVCKVTETSEQVCRSTLKWAGRAGKATLEFTNTKELVKDAIRYLQSCEGANLAEVLVERYGFAPDEAKKVAQQYVKDVGTLAGTAGAIGTASIAIKVLKRIIKGAAPAAEAAAATTVDPAPAAPQFTATLRPVQPVVLSETKDLTAARINQYADGRFYLPDMPQINESCVRDLHKIWHRNQETLLGIIGEAPIPRFGLHGTSSKGLREMLSTQTSLSKRTARSFPFKEEHIYVASYRYSITPLAQLADLYSIADYASIWLRQRGGLCVVETSEAIPFGVSFTTQAPLRVAFDTFKHGRFFNLMQREGDELLMQAGKNGRAAVAEEALLNAGEYLCKFTPDNFNSILRGILLDRDSLYPVRAMRALETISGDIETMTHRFKMQEVIMGAFEKLIKCEDFSSAQWDFYQKAGRKLANLPKRDMAVPLEDLIRIEKEFAQTDAAGKRFFSLYQKFFPTGTASDSTFPTINRQLIKHAKIDGLNNFNISGEVSLHSKDMVFEFYKILGKEGPLNSKQFIGHLKKFAKQNEAEKLYIELKFNDDLALQRSFQQRGSSYTTFPSSLIEPEFYEAIQKYPSVMRRAHITKRYWDDGNAYLFEVPLR